MANDTPRADSLVGPPVPEAFPPDDPASRFVVSMAMARNDIDIALRDVLRAGQEDATDFKYRVRLLNAHLVEALNALRWYRQEFQETRNLLERTSPKAKKVLKQVVRLAQDTAPLEGMRHATFHYPSPDPTHVPTSDTALGTVLGAMDDFGVHVHFSQSKNQVSVTFADEAAFRLACGLPRPSEAIEQLVGMSESARDGAIAFHKWFDGLLETYIDYRGLTVGQAIPIVPPARPPEHGDETPSG